MEIKGFYIYNRSGVINRFKTINEVKDNINTICDAGYSAIGIDYELKGNGFPGSIDVITRYDGKNFSLSSDLDAPYRSNLFRYSNFNVSISELKDLLSQLN